MARGSASSPPGLFVASREEALVVLRNTRRLRRLGILGVLVPVGVTAFLVALHRLLGFDMSFFVNGAPWTHRFWSGLFYGLMAGFVFLLLTMTRRCPRCGGGFFSRTGWAAHRSDFDDTPGVRANVFASRCVNCGLAIDGRDL